LFVEFVEFIIVWGVSGALLFVEFIIVWGVSGALLFVEFIIDCRVCRVYYCLGGLLLIMVVGCLIA
jgi:hypothetical protein